LAFGWFVVDIVQDRMRQIETPEGEGNEKAHKTNSRPMISSWMWSK